MPAFPPGALDDVEAANQRAFSQAQAEFTARQQMRLSSDGLIASQSQQGFVTNSRLIDTVSIQALIGDSTNTQILQSREVRDQPQTTGTQTSPGVQSGVPAPGNTTPAQHA